MHTPDYQKASLNVEKIAGVSLVLLLSANLGVIGWAASKLINEVSSLNTKMAVVVERVSQHEQMIDDHGESIKKLEEQIK